MKNKFKEHLPIFLILLLAAFLYTFKIWGDGFANAYYAAGVYSMGQNAHAFFFNSLDSAGFVTIDKPPLGFWIQVAFTKVFGFAGWVLVLPEAISGVLSVYLIYMMVKTRFGRGAGLVSAIVLTLTPIFAAVSRNNTIDGILIVLLVLAAGEAIKAAERGSMKHLIFSGILIGLGFNVKMLQAYMIVPAVYLTYLIFAKQKFIKKILACALSAAILIALSLSWVAAVDLTDEDSRPYIGSSDTNSALELAIGYNGLNRLLGRSSPLNGNTVYDDGGRALQKRPDAIVPGAYNPAPAQRPPKNGQNLPPNQPDKQSGGVMGEAGETSLIRLFNDKNAGQISWFMLPAMAAALAALVFLFIKKYRQDKKFAAYFFFAMSLIPMYIYFSFAEGITHRYYFAMMGPPIAALMGIGFHYLTGAKRRIWIPAAFAAAAIVQLIIHGLYNGWLGWLIPVCAAVFVLSLAAMVVMTVKKAKAKTIAALMSVLLILPGIWAATPAVYSDNSQLPIAGPELIKQKDSFDRRIDLSPLIDYLEQNRDGAKYLVMAESSMQFGAELILHSGEAVMVLGGFNGGDQVLTLDKFIAEVETGNVRYAVLSDNVKQGGNSEIFDWIHESGTIVPPRKYGGLRGAYVLYRLG